MDYHKNARLTVHSREQLARMVVRGITLKAAAMASKPGGLYRFLGLDRTVGLISSRETPDP